MLRGHYDATWTDEQVATEHQTITLKTNRRTIPIRAELVTAQTGSPLSSVLDRIDLTDAPERIRVRHSLPEGSKILRLTPPPDWRTLDMRIDFDPASGALGWDFDKALAEAWLRTRQSEFPYSETLDLQIFHTTGNRPAPLTRLQIELRHPGFACATPGKLDFGVLRAGDQATRNLVVEHGPLTLLRVEGPADMQIDPLLNAQTRPGQSAFEVTLKVESIPASIRRATFSEKTLRAWLSNGTTLRIPAFCTLSPVKHDTKKTNERE